MKVLWLASWYPSRLDPYNGDFIRRHAIAAAGQLPITVIYVVKDEKGQFTADVTVEEVKNGSLHEYIGYYKPASTGFSLIDKFLSFRKYREVFKSIISKYVEQVGLPDLCHVHVPVQAGLMALRIKAKYKVPYLVTEHWCGYNDLNPDNLRARNVIFRSAVKRVLESAALVTTVCEANKAELGSLFMLPETVIINNVADTNLFLSPAREDPAVFSFIHVSSLTYQKNLEGILQACSLIKHNGNWRLIIIGPHTTAQQELAKSIDLQDRITWLGQLAYEVVALQLKEASAMIMFSRFENQPCTIVEALCCGVPVIATKVGGIPEIINDTNGMLVESGDIAGLADAMNKMMLNHADFDRKSIAAAAQEKFSYRSVGKAFKNLYEKLLASTKRKSPV